MRRCVGCMESKPKGELIRIAGSPENGVHPDPSGKAPGRGIYLCPCKSCFEIAQKRNAVARGLRMNVTPEQMEQLHLEFELYEK